MRSRSRFCCGCIFSHIFSKVLGDGYPQSGPLDRHDSGNFAGELIRKSPIFRLIVRTLQAFNDFLHAQLYPAESPSDANLQVVLQGMLRG